jgi:hypothetical protein
MREFNVSDRNRRWYTAQSAGRFLGPTGNSAIMPGHFLPISNCVVCAKQLREETKPR